MNSIDYYIDLYGSTAWKGLFENPSRSTDSALAAMLRDEIATPGLTELSQFSRSALVNVARYFDPLRSFHSDTSISLGGYTSLGTDLSQMPPPSATYTDPLETILADADRRYKMTPIKFMHGGENNPFRLYSDYLNADGTVTLDTTGTISSDLL